MHPQLAELRPNRLLLDPNFDGYKLSLTEIPSVTQILQTGVNAATLQNSSQFSYLYAKLFSQHNHLIDDLYDDTNFVYFINTEWEIVKLRIDPLINEFVSEIVWKIPKNNQRQSGDYPLTLKFASDTIAVTSDGSDGTVHILDKTKTPWILQNSIKIEEIPNNFVILDATHSQDKLNLLLNSIGDGDNPDPTIKAHSIVGCISFKRDDEQNWVFERIEQFSSKGAIQYANFGQNCKSLYIASDSAIKKVGENEDSNGHSKSSKLNYTWSQTKEVITVNLDLNDVSKIQKSLVEISCESDSLQVKYDNIILISGDLLHKIDNSEEIVWSMEESKAKLTLILKKLDESMWSKLINGDDSGEYIPSSSEIDDSNLNLNKLTSDVEGKAEMGLTFNSEQMEECDYETEKNTIFERFSMDNFQLTHRFNLGTHQIQFSVNLDQNQAPAIALRYDIDTCIWQPSENSDNFTMIHSGTLSALGYIQASKQQKRFFSCSPDLNYSVICESRKHLFIYRQNKSVECGELKNRKTGRKIGVLAQQQVATLPTSTDEILGLHCTNSTLFVLTGNYITGLTLL